MLRILLMSMVIHTSVATATQAAEVYRWVDERGVTQYSEKPPDNRPSKSVNTRPAAASVDTEGKVLETPKPAVKPMSAPPAVIVVAPAPAVLAPPPAPPVRGMDFGVYTMLRRGMSEGELLLRAGRPDHEAVENGWNFVVKSLYYYPTIADPYITVVTLRSGRVAEIERTRKTF